MRRLLLTALIAIGVASHAWAWGTKEHIQLTRMAAARLIEDPSTPENMKAWLREAGPPPMTLEQERDYLLHTRIGMYPQGATGLSFWATVPDMLTFSDAPERKTEPFGVHERLLHYIDLEFFHPDESKRVYAADLSGKPKLENIPRNMSDPRWQRAGMLPFRVEQCYRELVNAIRAGRLVDKPGQFPRDEHATKWAGYLAHYVADNTQPQHATIDYKSQAAFPKVRRSPNVHSIVEYIPVDDDNNDYPELREEYWNAFAKALEEVKDPIESNDLWLATVQVSLRSYDALPLIGQAAAAAASQKDGDAVSVDVEKFYRFRGRLRGQEMSVLEMKARQQAWAVRRIQRLWLQAWNEARSPE